MAVKAFFDTSVLLAGLIDFGPQSAPAQSIMHALAYKQIGPVGTAWHCCLECFSVSTRLPPEYRLSPLEAVQLIESEVFGRMSVHDMPAGDRLSMLKAAARDSIAGGRIYDAHIADVARGAGAAVVVTDNRRHFVASLRHGLRVETPTEYLARMKAGE